MSEIRRGQPERGPQKPEETEQILETNEGRVEIVSAPEAEKPEDVEKEIEELKQVIAEGGEEEKSLEIEKESPEAKKARIEQYQERYLPKYLRKRGFISGVLTDLWTRRVKAETEREENIPENGPFIVIWNHFGGGDAEAFKKTFGDSNLHLVAQKEMLWDGFLNSINRLYMRKLGVIPIAGSLSNLSSEEKEAAIWKQGRRGKKVLRKIKDREEGNSPEEVEEYIKSVRQSISQIVAALSLGDSVGYPPEGIALNPEGMGKSFREKKELKKGYRGIELIAREYKELTGEELTIVPAAFIEDEETGKKKVVVGEPFVSSENNSGMSDTDYGMSQIAEMLPVEQRGYYKDKIQIKN